MSLLPLILAALSRGRVFSAHLTLLELTVAIDVRLSVRLSNAWIVTNEIILCQHIIAVRQRDSSSFLRDKFCGPQFRGSPRTSVLKTGTPLESAN